MQQKSSTPSFLVSICHVALLVLAYAVIFIDGFGQSQTTNSIQAESLTSRPFYGHASSGTPGTTALGIHLRPQGFAHIKENRASKTHAWIVRNNYLAVLAKFDLMASETDQMFEQVDQAFIEARDRVVRCGYPQAANLSPSLLTITIEQGAFGDSRYPEIGLGIAGLCDYNSSNGSAFIRVAIFNLKTPTELQDYRSLIRGECLNFFQCHLIGCATVIGAEWGSGGLPCQ